MTKKNASKVVETSTQVASPAAPATEAAPAAPAVVLPASSLAERALKAIEHVKMAIAILALGGPSITPEERKRLGKLRKGGDKFIPQVAQLAHEWGVEVRTQPTAEMSIAADTVVTLQPIVALLLGFLREIQDTSAVANSVSWSTASALYSVLKRMSRRDPKLAAQLAPVAEFFKYRHPVVKSQAAQKPAKPTKAEQRQAKALEKARALVAKADAEAAATAAPPPAEVPAPPAAAPTTHV